MSAVESRDGAHEFAGLGIDDIDVRAASQIEAMRRRIDDQVVPSALAAELPTVQDVIRLLPGKQGWEGKEAAKQDCGKKTKTALDRHETLPCETR